MPLEPFQKKAGPTRRQYLIGAAAIVLLIAGGAIAIVLLEVHHINRYLPEIDPPQRRPQEPHPPAAGRRRDDPRDRLRQAGPLDRRRRPGLPAPLGHADADPDGSRPASDVDPLDPPRPRDDTRLGHRRDDHPEDQRRLLTRRLGPHRTDDQADDAGARDQSHHRRRLCRLSQGDRRDRLRLRLRRPPLLQPEHRDDRRPTTQTSTSRPATRSCAAQTPSTTSATATPTPTSSASPASRTSSARPSSRSASRTSSTTRMPSSAACAKPSRPTSTATTSST